MFALFAFAVLWFIAQWYRAEGLTRLKAAVKRHPLDIAIPHRQVVTAIAILLVLIFSKYFYLVSITNYLTFYLIEKFGVSVQTSQLHLFMFVAAVAVGTIAGGPLGDRFGRKYIIWFRSWHLAFTLLLPTPICSGRGRSRWSSA